MTSISLGFASASAPSPATTPSPRGGWDGATPCSAALPSDPAHGHDLQSTGNAAILLAGISIDMAAGRGNVSLIPVPSSGGPVACEARSLLAVARSDEVRAPQQARGVGEATGRREASSRLLPRPPAKQTFPRRQ